MALTSFLKKKNSSGNVAKDRLKLVLVSERAGCSPEIMEQMKTEIIQVISKYIEIEVESFDFKITQNGSNGKNSISANIPIVDMRQKK